VEVSVSCTEWTGDTATEQMEPLKCLIQGGERTEEEEEEEEEETRDAEKDVFASIASSESV